MRVCVTRHKILKGYMTPDRDIIPGCGASFWTRSFPPHLLTIFLVLTNKLSLSSNYIYIYI